MNVGEKWGRPRAGESQDHMGKKRYESKLSEQSKGNLV